MGNPSDVAVKWEVLVMTWQEVFVGSPSGSPSGRGATGDALSLTKDKTNKTIKSIIMKKN